METISALRAVRSPNLHIAPVSGAISFIAQARRVPCIARPMPSWPRPFEGLTTEESIYQACIKRFHPILMTTMAALLGGVPMMVCKGGLGSEIRQPLGYAIVGGLALSQIFTLYTTRVVYIYFDKLQTRIFRRRRMQAPTAAEPQPAE